MLCYLRLPCSGNGNASALVGSSGCRRKAVGAGIMVDENCAAHYFVSSRQWNTGVARALSHRGLSFSRHLHTSSSAFYENLNLCTITTSAYISRTKNVFKILHQQKSQG